MLMGEYVYEKPIIGAPDLWSESDLEAITLPYGRTSIEPEPFGLDTGLGIALAESEMFYRSVGLDGLDEGLGGVGDLAGFFSSVKKALKKVTKPIQKRVTKDLNKLKKLRNKVTPKFLLKAEKKILGNAIKAQKKLFNLRRKIMPKFMRKAEDKLINKANAVAHRVTPSFIRNVQKKVAAFSPPALVPGREKFLAWLQIDNPPLHTLIMDKVGQAEKMQSKLFPAIPGVPASALMPPGVSGLGQGIATTTTAQPSIWDNIVSAAKNIIPTVIQAKAQRDIYKMQMERATKGLPPLNVEQVAPVIRTQVGIEPETRQALITEAGAGMQKMLVPLGIGAAALAAFMMLKK